MTLHRATETQTKSLNSRFEVNKNGNPDLYKIMEYAYYLLQQATKDADMPSLSDATPRVYPKGRYRQRCNHAQCSEALEKFINMKKTVDDDTYSLYSLIAITLKETLHHICLTNFALLDSEEVEKILDKNKKTTTQLAELNNAAVNALAYYLKLDTDSAWTRSYKVVHCQIKEIWLKVSVYKNVKMVNSILAVNRVILTTESEIPEIVPTMVEWDSDEFDDEPETESSTARPHSPPTVPHSPLESPPQSPPQEELEEEESFSPSLLDSPPNRPPIVSAVPKTARKKPTKTFSIRMEEEPDDSGPSAVESALSNFKRSLAGPLAGPSGENCKKQKK